MLPPEPDPFAPPDWLGTRLLPLDEDGNPIALPTPPELIDRRFVIEHLPPPVAGFEATVQSVPADVLARSTWREECPVTVEELRYLTMSFWGFDGRPHTGEMIVNAGFADDVVGVFAHLHEMRFPIEEMRVTAFEELDAPATGDGNNTGSFVCRPATGGSRWSMHAYGLAIDINPFHNPYQKGDVVLPELASAYLDRANVRPGMIVDGDSVTEAFAAIGWGWGGDFRTLADWMHFSSTGQ
jgi:hypothetical protein